MILKFRAFDKKTSKIYGVGLLDYYHDVAWLDDVIEDECVTVATRKLSEIELMQSTGLKDKNGQEIFEGDIVQFEDCYTETYFSYINKGIIEWSQGSFTVTNRDFIEMEDLLDGEILDVTIIGNIYENQDILEADDDQ